MKDSLKPGITHEHRFVVPVNKTVPHLYPESDEFGGMPEVFATGFMVGLLEWARTSISLASRRSGRTSTSAMRPRLRPGWR
jgi:predicted thioesterase